MGVQSDKEVAQLICGNDHDLLDLFSINIEEASKLKIYTQKQALDFIGSKVKVNRKISGPRRPWVSYIGPSGYAYLDLCNKN
jgi:DNA-directed RNA polymerase III subunit RPC2